ncbi:MAG: zinc-dependent metalloprotease [Actinomycetaceae bacterium]|nr:zinc-dependent metalloprotease [Actinomycetaceae bacterium]
MDEDTPNQGRGQNNHDDPNSGDPSHFEDFLRGMLGDSGASEALEAMRARGIDPESFGVAFPNAASAQAALSQFQFLINTTSGPVNWSMATDMAKQKAWGAGDPPPTAAQAERARQAMSVADLWLDAVTDFAPGQVRRAVWSRNGWIDATVDVWKIICEPVATNVSRALAEAMASQFSDEDGEQHLPEGIPDSMRALMGRTREMMPKISAMVFAGQIGQALSALAQECFGATDVGLPLAGEGTTALVVHNIEGFADGLDIPFEEVLQFIATRECAHQRLFHAVPWLSGDLVRAVEEYSAHIAIDTEEIARAASSIDPSDPQSMEITFESGIFSPQPTTQQKQALARLENLLALVEGWVEVITLRACAPYLPHVDQLSEMMRRRRASGGPAEQVLGQLIGLDLRPRKARGAATIFTLVEGAHGRGQRDSLWDHPHLVPTPEDLDSPDSFLLMRQAASEKDADIDAALSQILDGTLGWAEGMTPETDSEGDSTADGPDLADGSDGSTSPDSPDSPATS